MRFRYIDSKGREITLDSVEALAARIELGAVGPATELFDASTDTWAPAERHEVFRQLQAEAAARGVGGAVDAPVVLATPPSSGSPSRMAGHGDPGRSPESPGAASTDETLTLRPDLDASVAAALAASGPELPDVDDASSTTPSGSDLATSARKLPDDGSYDLEIAGDLEVEAAPSLPVNPVALDRQPPIEGFRAAVDDAWHLEAQPPPPGGASGASGVTSEPSKLEIDDQWGAPKEEVHPFDAPDRFPDDTGPGGWPAEAMLEDARFAANPGGGRVVEVLTAPAVQWAFLAASLLVMGLFGSAIGQGLLIRALLTSGGVLAAGLVTGLVLWRDPDRRTLIPAATFALIAAASVPLFVLGSRAEAAGTPQVGQVQGMPRTARPAPAPVPPANPGELAMDSRALEGLIEGLDSLASAYGVDRRPPAWLHGIYLANASQYPEVEDYWRRYADYIVAVETQDADWFRSSYEARLLAAGIRSEAVDGIVTRGVERFRGTRERREKLYATMRELAQASVELHAFLLDNEDDIAWEPFEQEGVSEAPVVEAVPSSPEIEDRMWALIARVARALESISELGETSPARLQQAMVDSIRASLR